jgi:hypothetical protein
VTESTLTFEATRTVSRPRDGAWAPSHLGNVGSVASTSLSGGRTMRSAILHGAAALATFALVLTSAPDAGAATVLATVDVPANLGQVPTCVITNVDKKPTTVTVQLFDAAGILQIPASNTCPVPPATFSPRSRLRSATGAQHPSVLCGDYE